MRMEENRLRCAWKRSCVENTYFKIKNIHKFTWVYGVDESKSLLDFILVQRVIGINSYV